MRSIKYFFPILLGVLIFSSGCEKDEIIVEDNTAPPDSTIPSLVLQNYANKCYISLLGREPDETEMDGAMLILREGGFSRQSRKQMLASIFEQSEYRNKMVEINAIKLLNSYDTTEILTQIYIYEQVLTDPLYADFTDEIQFILDRLELLLQTPQDFRTGAIDMRGLHRRLIYNDIYDQINMGSFNFVLSLFNHFLFRDPTQSEHESGITMVDGFVAVVLYETGSSKEEFIDIFLNSDDYYEGQVRELYLRHLFREPNSEEQTSHASRYRNSGNYQQLQQDILSLDEFAGS